VDDRGTARGDRRDRDQSVSAEPHDTPQRWQTPLTTDLHTAPGGFGTFGVKESPLVGPAAFSLGVTVAVLEGAVVELLGASFSVLGLHPAKGPTATSAALPPRTIFRVMLIA